MAYQKWPVCHVKTFEGLTVQLKIHMLKASKTSIFLVGQFLKVWPTFSLRN